MTAHRFLRSFGSMTTTAPILHIAMVEPDIAPNVGTVARMCAATGIRLHLIGKLGFRLNDKSLRRAGLDYWQHVDLHQHLSWDAFRSAFPELRCYALSSKVSNLYTAISFSAGDCLVLGSETHGLPERLLHGPGALASCTIPMPTGHVRCINVAMAAGIVAYEALRQISTSPTR